MVESRIWLVTKAATKDKHANCMKANNIDERDVHCFPEGNGAAVASVFFDMVVGLEGDMVVADHFVMQILRYAGNVFENVA